MRTGHLKELKLAAFLVAMVMVPVLFTFLVRQEVAINTPISPKSLEELSVEYRKNGMQQFFDAKTNLKRRVSRNLKDNNNHEAYFAALNVALYLFPELLDDENMEKDFAQKHLRPLQEKIESSPGSKEAQKNFEELRNMVWGYENPKEDEQGLSEYARQMLKVYGTLSWK